jgi:hypothetical protein
MLCSVNLGSTCMHEFNALDTHAKGQPRMHPSTQQCKTGWPKTWDDHLRAGAPEGAQQAQQHPLVPLNDLKVAVRMHWYMHVSSDTDA